MILDFRFAFNYWCKLLGTSKSEPLVHQQGAGGCHAIPFILFPEPHNITKYSQLGTLSELKMLLLRPFWIKLM